MNLSKYTGIPECEFIQLAKVVCSIIELGRSGIYFREKNIKNLLRYKSTGRSFITLWVGRLVGEGYLRAKRYGARHLYEVKNLKRLENDYWELLSKRFEQT